LANKILIFIQVLLLLLLLLLLLVPIPMTARSKVKVCGRSPAESVGSNPTGGMEVFALWVLCVVW